MNSCTHAKRGASRCRASSRTWKMRASYGQSVQDAGATYCSTVRHAPSDPSLCHTPYAAHLESPVDMPPRSRCNSEHCDTLLVSAPRVSDMWRGCGRQRRKPRLGEWRDIAQSISSVCDSFSGQMTKVHPTLRWSPADHSGLAQSAWSAIGAKSELFLSHSLTVLRATPKVRVKPRSELRS